MTVHPIDTEALRKLADAATEGPWKIVPSAAMRGAFAIYGVAPVLRARYADAEFIAAARTALPALLDALAAAEHRAIRAEARIKAVQDVLEESEARGPVGMTFNGTPFPAWIGIATIRRALDS